MGNTPGDLVCVIWTQVSPRPSAMAESTAAGRTVRQNGRLVYQLATCVVSSMGSGCPRSPWPSCSSTSFTCAARSSTNSSRWPCPTPAGLANQARDRDPMESQANCRPPDNSDESVEGDNEPLHGTEPLRRTMRPNGLPRYERLRHARGQGATGAKQGHNAAGRG